MDRKQAAGEAAYNEFVRRNPGNTPGAADAAERAYSAEETTDVAAVFEAVASSDNRSLVQAALAILRDGVIERRLWEMAGEDPVILANVHAAADAAEARAQRLRW